MVEIWISNVFCHNQLRYRQLISNELFHCFLVSAIVILLLQYNPEITGLTGLATLDLYWRELFLVGYDYNIISLQLLQNKCLYLLGIFE